MDQAVPHHRYTHVAEKFGRVISAAEVPLWSEGSQPHTRLPHPRVPVPGREVPIISGCNNQQRLRLRAPGVPRNSS